jgi:hypothetical protein
LADSLDVHGSAAFVDLLDRELSALGVDAAVSACRFRVGPVVVTAPLAGIPQFYFQSTPYAALGRKQPRPRRPPLTLTAPQRDALAALNALGAGLDDEISASDVRSAFRRLARQCHPDRHPGSSAAEKAQLSRQFATLTDHRRCLAAAVDADCRIRR